MAVRASWGSVNDGRALMGQLMAGFPGYSGGMAETGPGRLEKGQWYAWCREAPPGKRQQACQPAGAQPHGPDLSGAAGPTHVAGSGSPQWGGPPGDQTLSGPGLVHQGERVRAGLVDAPDRDAQVRGPTRGECWRLHGHQEGVCEMRAVAGRGPGGSSRSGGGAGTQGGHDGLVLGGVPGPCLKLPCGNPVSILVGGRAADTSRQGSKVSEVDEDRPRAPAPVPRAPAPVEPHRGAAGADAPGGPRSLAAAAQPPAPGRGAALDLPPRGRQVHALDGLPQYE